MNGGPTVIRTEQCQRGYHRNCVAARIGIEAKGIHSCHALCPCRCTCPCHDSGHFTRDAA